MRHGIGEFSPEVLARAGVDHTVVELAGALLAVMDHVRQLLERVAADHDLNAPAALALRLLDEPMAQREVAAATDCDPSYVTTMIDRLEAVGAVQRQPDPDDRRVKRVVLTDTGERLREQVGVDLLAGLGIGRSLDAEERTQLLDLLTRALPTGGGEQQRRDDASTQDVA